MARPQKSRKNLLDSFGERYHVIEHDGGYLLYDKEGHSKRSNGLYLGYFFISTDGARFKFEDDYYQTASELIEAITEYNKKLPFDAEIYNPMYRKHIKIEMALHDYLEILGFKMSWGADAVYYLEDCYGQRIFSIRIEVKEDTTTGIIIRRVNPLSASDKWVESSFTDLDSAIGAVNTILAMYCASINAITMNVLDGLTSARVSEVFDKTFDVRSLSTYTDDAKQKTIEMLENELKKLKGEI